MYLSAKEITAKLPWDTLIPHLDQAMTENFSVPHRHHHTLETDHQPSATLLLMPAWKVGQYLGIKQVTVFPGNRAQGLPSLTSNYTLYCGRTGQQLLSLDGNALTARRTAAASALASRYLSRPDTSSMLLVGAGRVGWELVPAHCSVRPIETIWVHDQFEPAAENLVTHLLAHGYKAQVCPDTTLADVAGKVDLISCATLAESSVILGNWVRPGTHIDLVGSFTPTMREVDDCLMQQAEIYVDFREQALAESGELILPISTGAISTKDIVADLPQLCRGEVLLPLENDYQAKRITVFKAVGDAREDLATAILLHQISSSSQ